MPPRRSRTRQRGRGRRGIGTVTSFRNQVITQLFIEQPFTITQASSGTGGISSSGGSSGASVTSVGAIQVDPFTMGGRFAQVAGMFTQYRINSIEFEFTPDSTASGYLENIAGGTTTPVLINRDFAWDLVMDPVNFGTFTYTQILLCGGVYTNTSRKSKVQVGRQRWCYTSTTSSFVVPPSGVDFRQVSPLLLRFAFAQASTTGTQKYGVLMCRANVSFRGPLVLSTVIGVASPGPSASLSEEKVVDDDLVEVRPRS